MKRRNVPVLPAAQVRLLRARAQRLHAQQPSESKARAVEISRVLGAVCGIQAQDLPAALLSVRARSAGLTARQIEQARQQPGALAWTWCLRGTLHLLAAEDARWLVPLLGPALVAADRRRMQQLGWDDRRAEQGIQMIEKALEKRGPLTRPEIVTLLQENGLPHEGQAPVHLLYRAALEGHICSGPDRGKEHTYTQFESWLGRPESLPRADGLARLALRYLQAYAPAGPDDLAAWCGLRRGEAHDAWQGITDPLVEVSLESEGQRPTWMLKEQLAWLDEPTGKTALVRLLPRFETLWMGYANRDLLINPAYASRVNTGGGIIHPLLLVDGLVAGTWKTTRGKAGQTISVVFEPLPEEIVPLIEAEAVDIARFLEDPVTLRVNPVQ